MNFNELIEHAFARADATQTLWNFYALVATAILGFLASAKTPVTRPSVRYVLLLGFVAFAVANYLALESIRAQREALVSVARTLSTPPFVAVIETLKPPSVLSLRAFHTILDVALCAAIWFVPRVHDRESAA